MSLVSVLAFVACQPAASPEFFLRPNDRVVFYGDSITDNGGYGRFVETFVLTRYPNLNVTFVNGGWGGDRVSGGSGGTIDVRLQRDVIARRPTVVTIMLGMNDGNVRPFEEPTFSRYSEGYKKILDRLQSALPTARIVLIKPSPYDDVTQAPGFAGGYNGTLVRYGEWLEQEAQRRGLPIVDFNRPLVEALEKGKASEPDVARRLIPDRIHPEPAGHLVMAAALLTAWNASKVVTRVDLDASRQAVATRQNAWVRDLRFGPALEWTQVDEVLPFPIDMKNPRMAMVVRAVGAIRNLNRQELRITGLPAPEYRLEIDGNVIATLSREQLADGVELTNYDTPMLQQAGQVQLLTQQRAALQYARWRNVEVGLAEVEGPQRENALRSLDALEQAVIRRQRDLAKPLPRRYRLTPTS